MAGREVVDWCMAHGACGASGPSGGSLADGSQRRQRGASWRPRPTAGGWANGRVCQDMRAVVDLNLAPACLVASHSALQGAHAGPSRGRGCQSAVVSRQLLVVNRGLCMPGLHNAGPLTVHVTAWRASAAVGVKRVDWGWLLRSASSSKR
jgi:hypothetical protein